MILGVPGLAAISDGGVKTIFGMSVECSKVKRGAVRDKNGDNKCEQISPVSHYKVFINLN